MERRTVARNRPGHRAGAHTDGRTGRDGPGAPYDPEGRARRRIWMARGTFFTSSSDQRERSRAVAEGALQWGAGWGKAGPRQAAGRGSNQQPKKIEGAPFRALPLLLNKGRPVLVGQVLCWPSAPALVGFGGRQACSIAGSD
jgi:hypothetical protein